MITGKTKNDTLLIIIHAFFYFVFSVFFLLSIIPKSDSLANDTFISHYHLIKEED